MVSRGALFGAIVVLALGGAGAAYALTRKARPVGPTASAVWYGDGTSTTFTPGVSDMKLAVSVPSTSVPTSVQAFINGVGASVHTWDIGVTGYTYVIDFGLAPNQPGTFDVYALVTFSDGSQSKTNDVTAVII